MRALRAVGMAVCAATLVAACSRSPGGDPPPTPSPTGSLTASPTAGSARLEELRAGEQYLEFAEHERAARAPHARLAWENFAPIVDGRRVEWANKAELWDSIAPKIRDEALLLGPEYREPLWDNTNAIPNGVSMAWNDEDTEGRGHFVQFSITYQTERGAARRYWGFLIPRERDGTGELGASMPVFDTYEYEFDDEAEEAAFVTERQWSWVVRQRAEA